MAALTRQQLTTLINSRLANNSTGAITAQTLREMFTDVVNNCFNDPVVLPVAVPAGTIIWVATTNAPSGYLKANGQEVSRTVYPELFAALGIRFGAGNGTTTFNLPDLRGEFVRGWDDGRQVDAGRTLGSFQRATGLRSFESSVNITHAHNFITNVRLAATNPDAITPITDLINLEGSRWGDFSHGHDNRQFHTISSTSGSHGELHFIHTRPRNLAMLACIKF